MGRIDEALRRAGTPRRESEPQKSGIAGPFVSPWTFGDGEFPIERTTPVVPAPVPVPIRVAATHRAEAPLIERLAPGWRERVAFGPEANLAVSDQFRRLAATLLHVRRNEPLRTIMVTSAVPADGKSLTAFNLALVLSESYRRRVLLVEGDLRRPAISRAVGIPPGPGLTEALKATDDRKATLVQLTEMLTLLPAGRPDSDPLSALASARLQALLQDASEKFEWVIVDTPPLAMTTDASLMCPLVDSTLLVVRAGRTPHDDVQKAIETLGRDRILGVVLNGSDEASASQYGYYSAEVTDEFAHIGESDIPASDPSLV
jgi:receptor protein-tyrosine kinase